MLAPFKVASIGNPAPYTHTLHSAGHTVLHALRVQLSFPPLAPTPRRSGADGGLRTSTPDSPITLWQSRSLMNDSGRGVKAAWEHYRRENHASLPFSTATRHNDELNNGEDEEGEEQIMLVVLHDELEAPLGKIKVRRPASGKKGGGGGGSARGHNGLKSILAGLPDLRFTRIGVGIGRPTSRDPDDVARYVLRKMTAAEKETLEGPVAGLVLQALRGLLK
ncbi:MAG: aminoacyl-tRNA hydrolase [Thelocarpon superellum]|nr:MAG: aminoacyl-tRNA hydrolase [Thelocarpon superellum]